MRDFLEESQDGFIADCKVRLQFEIISDQRPGEMLR
jgi:hypothetical protein